MTLSTQVEIWHRYGAYLSGVSSLSRDNPDATFEQFINACHGRYGCWGREALRNAWNAGRK